jgi:hypothetical protein
VFVAEFEIRLLGTNADVKYKRSLFVLPLGSILLSKPRLKGEQKAENIFVVSLYCQCAVSGLCLV